MNKYFYAKLKYVVQYYKKYPYFNGGTVLTKTHCRRLIGDLDNYINDDIKKRVGMFYMRTR